MKALITALLVLFVPNAIAQCYQLYRGNQLISEDTHPPFDISFDPEHGPSDDLLAGR